MRRTSDITLEECVAKLKQLKGYSMCYVDEIPKVLMEDFNKFIVGHTLCEIEGGAVTYDIDKYYRKIMNQGISYAIRWKI